MSGNVVSVWFYSLTDGLLTGKSFSGLRDVAESRTPEGQGFIEGVTDWLAQRVDLLADPPALVDYQPPAPPDDPMRTWAWDADKRRWVAVPTLAAIKAAKNTEINTEHERANLRFAYAGKWFQADAQSWQQITAVQGWVSDADALPPDFPGYWKADDNSLTPIADAATWRQFYAAAIARGTANFRTSESLKASLADAESAEEVEAIQWPADPETLEA